MATAPNPLPCPCCGETMTLGNADIHSTGLGFLVFGYGYQHLYFKPRRESRDAPRTKEVKVLDYTQTPSCFLCPKCGTFVLPPGPVSAVSNPASRS